MAVNYEKIEVPYLREILFELDSNIFRNGEIDYLDYGKDQRNEKNYATIKVGISELKMGIIVDIDTYGIYIRPESQSFSTVIDTKDSDKVILEKMNQVALSIVQSCVNHGIDSEDWSYWIYNNFLKDAMIRLCKEDWHQFTDAE
jgi:hypothetical protein